MLQGLRQKFGRETFLRSVAVLMSGTAASQAVLVLILPLLTRIYSPDDFSVLAVYVSALSILSISACLRLEIAIPLPRDDERAASLLVLALTSALIVSLVVAVTVGAFPQAAGVLVEQLGPYIWLLPIGVWFSSSYSALQYWSSRKRRFGDIAKTRLGQAVGGASTQIGLGLFGHAPIGLIVGHIVIGGAGVFGLARQAIRHDWRSIRPVTLRSMRDALAEYQRFPRYSTFDSIINVAGLRLPVLIIASYALGPQAGLLMLAMRTMQAPMALLGTSVGQVFLAEAPTKQRDGQLAAFSAEIMGGLAKVGIGPLVFAAIVAPIAFPYIFGREWADSGLMVSWMAPWFILQFISSPVSMIMHVLQRQREMLALTAFGLVARVGPVMAAALLAPHLLVEAFATGSAVYYFVLTVLVFARAGCGVSHVWKVVRSGGQSAFVGAAAGALLMLVAEEFAEG